MPSLPNDSANLIQLFAPNQMPPADYFCLATVTSLNPLRVAFEGNVDDTTGNPVETPQTMVALKGDSFFINDRVLMAQVGDTWVILGAIGVRTDSFTGTALKGTYDSTRPIMTMRATFSGTSDSSGFVSVLFPVTPITSILQATVSDVVPSSAADTIVVCRPDVAQISPTAAMYYQTRTTSTGAAVGSRAFHISTEIAYQI